MNSTSAEQEQPDSARADLAWNVAAMICSQGTTFLASIVTANLLGREMFGEYAGIQSTQFTLTNVAQLASWFTASKFVAEYHVRQPARAAAVLRLCHRLSLGGGAMAALLLVTLAPWLAEVAYQAPQLTSGLMITAFTVLFATLSMFQMGALAGLGGHRSLAIAAIVTSLMYLPASAAATIGCGLNGAVLALLLRFAIQWLIQHRLLGKECARRQLPRQAADDSHALELFCRFSLPAAIAGCCSWPVLWLATTCLARQAEGFHELALYTAANTLRMMALFLPFTISIFTWSRLNHHRGLGHERQSATLFRRNLLTAGALSVMGALGIIVAAPVVLPWFGKSFADGRTVLNVMMLAAIPEALTHAAQQAMHSKSRIWRSLWGIALPRDLAIVLLAYGLTPRYGAVGLAMSLGIGWSLALAASLWFAWRHRHGDPPRAASEPVQRVPSWQHRGRALSCQN